MDHEHFAADPRVQNERNLISTLIIGQTLSDLFPVSAKRDKTSEAFYLMYHIKLCTEDSSNGLLAIRMLIEGRQTPISG